MAEENTEQSPSEDMPDKVQTNLDEKREEGCIGSADKDKLGTGVNDKPINDTRPPGYDNKHIESSPNTDEGEVVDGEIVNEESFENLTVEVPTPDELRQAGQMLRQWGTQAGDKVSRFIEEIAKHGDPDQENKPL